MSRRWGWSAIAAHESEVLAYAHAGAQPVPGVRVIGTAAEKCSVLTFAMEGVHPQDIGALLDLDGIAIRTGHHCAMPLHERFGLAASARASIGALHHHDDIDAFDRQPQASWERCCNDGTGRMADAIRRSSAPRRSWPTSRR